MSYVDDTALELAKLAITEHEAGNEKIVDQIGEVVGASSQSLQEAYSTYIRVLRAEKRAREILAASLKQRAAAPAAAAAGQAPETAR